MKNPDLVAEYLKSERQWPRYCRVRKARMSYRNATDDKAFWLEVLNRLGALPSGRVIPSTATLLERSLKRDEERKSAEIPVAEVQ